MRSTNNSSTSGVKDHAADIRESRAIAICVARLRSARHNGGAPETYCEFALGTPLGMNETSLSLLELARRGEDRQSWQRLVELYAPLMKRWLQAYDVQAADADDLVQDVLAVIVRELPAFEHNQRPGAFRNWLRQILVNRTRNFWRARGQRPVASGGSSVLDRLQQLEDEQSAASRVWDAEHDRDVMARLLELIRPNFLPKTWEAFQRQIFGGQRADQVAAELQMPISSVYVARSRVLAALRREAAGLVDPSARTG